jgi:hypothetical protein
MCCSYSDFGVRKLELHYGRWFTANQFILAASPSRLTTCIFFQLNTCHHSPYVTSSLTRGWVCRLQLLLALTSAVILRSESRGIHDHILLSRPPNLEGQAPVFISLRKKLAQLYLQAPDSLFVTSYDSQGYGRGIRPASTRDV